MRAFDIMDTGSRVFYHILVFFVCIRFYLLQSDDASAIMLLVAAIFIVSMYFYKLGKQDKGSRK